MASFGSYIHPLCGWPTSRLSTMCKNLYSIILKHTYKEYGVISHHGRNLCDDLLGCSVSSLVYLLMTLPVWCPGNSAAFRFNHMHAAGGTHEQTTCTMNIYIDWQTDHVIKWVKVVQLQPQTPAHYTRQQCWGLTVSGAVWDVLSAVTQDTNFVVLCIAFRLCVCKLFLGMTACAVSSLLVVSVLPWNCHWLWIQEGMCV